MTAYATTSTIRFTNYSDGVLWVGSSANAKVYVTPEGDQDVLVNWDFGSDARWGEGLMLIFDLDLAERVFLARWSDGDIAGPEVVSLVGGKDYQFHTGAGNGTGDAYGTITAIPAPGELAFLGLASLVGGRRRRG